MEFTLCIRTSSWPRARESRVPTRVPLRNFRAHRSHSSGSPDNSAFTVRFASRSVGRGDPVIHGYLIDVGGPPSPRPISVNRLRGYGRPSQIVPILSTRRLRVKSTPVRGWAVGGRRRRTKIEKGLHLRLAQEAFVMPFASVVLVQQEVNGAWKGYSRESTRGKRVNVVD